jgi:DNA-binding HxlR family transcriptional regulator
MNTPRPPCILSNECGNYTAATIEALRCLEGKWKIVILSCLFRTEVMRFSELEKAIEGITQKMLIQQLKDLEKDGLVQRTVYPQVPPKVEYTLTDTGYGLSPVIEAMMNWVALRTRQASHDLTS